MQKETETSNLSQTDENTVPRATSEAQKSENSDGSADTSILDNENQNPTDEATKNNAADMDFEKLIKGPYKDAFAKKVQGIINKRFKDQKTAENKAAEQSPKDNASKKNEITQDSEQSATESDSTYANLLAAGIDPETAYRVLHLNEFMDSSMRYGAELAAKQLANSIREKAARPSESALNQKGYTAKASVGTLSPEKRKELAKKALMGEQIGF